MFVILEKYWKKSKLFRYIIGSINNLNKIKFIGYAFQIEMKFATRQLGFSIAEVPITFKDREEGVSKMSLSIFKEAIIGVLKMRWWSFFNRYD